jgi:F-type H+-transporting ATPase subunit gamma
MAKARAFDRRRKAIRNIRRITRTMELIATARFKKAMDRAHAATAYTRRMTALVKDLARSGLKVSHPLLEERSETKSARLLVLTGNRGLCGGYNSNVQRAGLARWNELQGIERRALEISGKRAAAFFRYRKIVPEQAFTHFEDKPSFEEVDVLASRYLASFLSGELDRLDVAYTRFDSMSKQTAVVETLLPLGSLAGSDKSDAGGGMEYEFFPSAESILEEIVPASFKIRLFKVFLDAAVSEQVARMTAMKAATENADDLIRQLGMAYNRARQGQITSELLDVVGGAAAVEG